MKNFWKVEIVNFSTRSGRKPPILKLLKSIGKILIKLKYIALGYQSFRSSKFKKNQISLKYYFKWSVF